MLAGDKVDVRFRVPIDTGHAGRSAAADEVSPANGSRSEDFGVGQA